MASFYPASIELGDSTFERAPEVIAKLQKSLKERTEYKYTGPVTALNKQDSSSAQMLFSGLAVKPLDTEGANQK